MRNREPLPLPIDDVVPRLRGTLRHGTSAVLVAPPGAGKTTHVPLALMDEPWLDRQKIVILEPRRLAARAAAHRMAQLLGERVGGTIGFRVRNDSHVGPRTRVEVVTEGILTRHIASDPTLEGIGLVIFDEFHERSLHADLGLALTLHTRELLRDDLRVLVMSATLDGAAVAQLLGEAPVITSEGKAFPVATHYVPPRNLAARDATLLATIERALREHDGDVLVFLPGAAEIRRAAQALGERILRSTTHVIPLFGALALSDQDRAIQPSPPGQRKIVLATTIAQTSLTIDGVRVVIDVGLTRVPRYSPRTGMTRLETVRVSRAAADQRRGRAGRLAPGVCYRLWDSAEDASLKAHDTPEIIEADLAPLVLDLAAAGVADPGELRWLDPPTVSAVSQARELLRELGALEAQDAITPHGRKLSSLGTHPRLAHMLLGAGSTGQKAVACELAAMIDERDFLVGPPSERDPDIATRLDLLHGATGKANVDAGALHQVRTSADRWRERLGVQRGSSDSHAAGWLLALAYPDRIAQRRAGSTPRFVLRNGVGAVLPAGSVLHNESYIVAAELDGRRPEGLILLAVALDRGDIEKHFADQIETRDAIEWDETTSSVSARRMRALGALILADDPLPNPDPADVARVIEASILAGNFALLNWTKDAAAMRQRIAFLHAHDPSWPDVSDAGLRGASNTWLAPRLSSARRRADVERIAVSEAMLDLLSWRQRAQLEELAPTHLTVPSGSRVPIDYSNPRAPVLAVRLQEVFGLTQTPKLLGGRVPLTLHLLSPSQRPVQVTTDLESFWRNSYFDVRKELRGRYPKHHWPDDPLNATPTRRTKRRGS